MSENNIDEAMKQLLQKLLSEKEFELLSKIIASKGKLNSEARD